MLGLSAQGSSSVLMHANGCLATGSIQNPDAQKVLLRRRENSLQWLFSARRLTLNEAASFQFAAPERFGGTA